MADAGQDVWILSQFEPDFKGYAVELGANDGVDLSNTFMLEQQGWDVLCIEPAQRHQEGLRISRKRVLTCACDREPKNETTLWVHGSTGTLSSLNPDVESKGSWETNTVTVLTLNQCLMISGFPRIDVISIDVDGYEFRILEGLDIDKWKPKVALVENVYGEAERVIPYMQEHGYKHVGKFNHDQAFVRSM